MPVYDEIPAWEKRGERPPWEAAEDVARERVLEERRRNHVEVLSELDRRRAAKSVPPPPAPPEPPRAA
jgi:hypothetical protein